MVQIPCVGRNLSTPPPLPPSLGKGTCGCQEASRPADILPFVVYPTLCIPHFLSKTVELLIRQIPSAIVCLQAASQNLIFQSAALKNEVHPDGPDPVASPSAGLTHTHNRQTKQWLIWACNLLHRRIGNRQGKTQARRTHMQTDKAMCAM